MYKCFHWRSNSHSQSHIILRSIIFATVVFVSSSQAWGWGKAGHEVVGKIAEAHLTNDVLEKIKDILDDQSLAEASTWPDQIKNAKGWTHTRTYHYMSIDDDSNYYDALESLTASERKYSDIVRSLLKAEDMLKDDKTAKEDKANAIRFLVHFIGDLHQPLHIGRYEDTGGNAIKLKWFNAQSNLHSIWDNAIIKTFISRSKELIKSNLLFFNALNPLNSAVEITATQNGGDDIYPFLPDVSADQISEWQNSYIMSWVEESLQMRDEVYYKYTGSSESYYLRNHKALNVRLLQAGYRLAAWLNALIANRNFKNTEATQMRANMIRILGNDYTEQTVLINTAAFNNKNSFMAVDSHFLSQETQENEAYQSLFEHDCNH